LFAYLQTIKLWQGLRNITGGAGSSPTGADPGTSVYIIDKKAAVDYCGLFSCMALKKAGHEGRLCVTPENC